MRAYGRLERFLAPRRRGGAFAVAFDGSPALKDPIESIGIPHVEIGRVAVDGRDASLTRRLRGGEAVDVFPRLVQPVGDPPRFVLDVHLGRLAGYLRLLGIDTAYRNDADDDALMARGIAEGRVLLTRDTGLLKRARVGPAAFVYATAPLQQLAEVNARFALDTPFAPFTRCAHCNGVVAPTELADVAEAVPAGVRRSATRFSRCSDCRRVYWDGSHGIRLHERFATAGIVLPSEYFDPTDIRNA